MSEFIKSGPMSVRSEEGAVETHRVGVDVRYFQQLIHIDSEMLADPMSIVLYVSVGPLSTLENAAEVLRYATAALEFLGFSVETI